MKDKKQKISFDKRYLLLLVAGFLTGRVWLYGINPFGVALFAAVAAERKGRKLLALFVLADMFSSTEGLSLIKYLTLFLLVLSLEKIQEKWTSHTGQAVYLALLTGGLNMAAGILNSILAVNTAIKFFSVKLPGHLIGIPRKHTIFVYIFPAFLLFPK